MNFGATQFAGGHFMDRHVDGGQEKIVEANLVDSMRALTINQLTKAQQQAATPQELMCDGRNITQVTIVGLLTGKYQDESYNVMTVYDGTGTIEVREFRDGDADLVQERQNLLVENTYVRVYGSFKGKNDEGPSDRLGYINAFAVRPVEDHNEVLRDLKTWTWGSNFKCSSFILPETCDSLCLVTHHQLDVIFQHLYLTQSQNLPGAGNVSTPGAFGMGMPGGMPGGAPMGGNVLQPHGSAQSAVDAVYNFLKEHSNSANPSGVPMNAIVQGLAPQFREDAIVSARGELENLGKIYDTGSGYAAV